MSGDGDRKEPEAGPVELLGGGETSLLEAVDGLLNRGVHVKGDLVLGLADVDLIYLHLSTLLAAADRVLGTREEPPPPTPGGDELRPYTPRGDSPTPAQGVGTELASARAEAASEPSGPADAGTASVDALRDRLERSLGARAADAEPSPTEPAEAGSRPPRWNADPEDVERSVARLVLALVEFLRKLMERQAIRRMEEGTLTEVQVERLGQALMRLEETVHDMARRFGLRPEDLNLDLGPLGRLT